MHGAQLLIEFGAVVLALALARRFAGRLGISPITLYLVAGLAFGRGGPFEVEVAEGFITASAEIGVMLLLLMLGLEYSAEELLGNLRASASAGVIDAALNALPGLALGLLWGWGPVAAVALAGITWISSSGVIARVLGDLERLGNRETPTILSVLVIEDLAMAFYLPLLVALLSGKGLAAGALSLGGAVAAVVVVLYLATRRHRAISRLVQSDDPEALLLSVLGLTVLVAGVAQAVQVSAAVGAFLVGIAISGTVAHRAATVMTPLRDLTAALFFLSFGMSTELAKIPPVLLGAFLLAVVSMATKVLTGYLAAKRTGIAPAGRWRTGFTLVPRGEFSIVIAGLVAVSALDIPDLVPLATAYVLITAVAGPMLARVPDTSWFRSRLVKAVRNRVPDARIP